MKPIFTLLTVFLLMTMVSYAEPPKDVPKDPESKTEQNDKVASQPNKDGPVKESTKAKKKEDKSLKEALLRELLGFED